MSPTSYLAAPPRIKWSGRDNVRNGRVKGYEAEISADGTGAAGPGHGKLLRGEEPLPRDDVPRLAGGLSRGKGPPGGPSGCGPGGLPGQRRPAAPGGLVQAAS